MSSRVAVLLDIVSIQDFIFKSNELRVNLGASYLVEEVYHKYLAAGLTKITGGTLEDELKNLDSWMSADSQKDNTPGKVNFGYIGGGNALLFFENEGFARDFIEEWTKILLINVPGLTSAVAFGPLSENDPEFRTNLNLIVEQLQTNKSEHIPVTLLPRHGITTECRSSGASAEVYNSKSNSYVSAGANAKINAADSSKEKLKNLYHELFGNKQYTFTNELDKLGGISGEDSHIAIVHIDGNDVGERFNSSKSLDDIEKLSKFMRLATERAFKEVIRMAVKNYDDIMPSLGFDRDSADPQRKYPVDKDNNYILPIRPIILGGDDVTFVCDGKLGIFFAKIFIEAYESMRTDNIEKLTACAGIAIIKTKYPFYRGVSLANELCRNAKLERKDPDKGDLNASYLDFQISFGGIAGGLHELRASFKAPRGYLLYRPFRITPKEPFDEYSLDMFIEKARKLKYIDKDNANLPNNRINELNEVLTLSEEAGLKFVRHEKSRNRKLPDINGHQYEEALFENGLTPYHDMIEILRFYPDFALWDEYGEKQ